MTNLRATVVLDTPLVRVGEVTCTSPRSKWGPEEGGGTAEVVLPRRGIFRVLRRGGSTVADPASVLLLGGSDAPHRVSHPVDGGDECTVLAVRPDLLMEALGDAPANSAVLRPSTQIQARLLATRLARDGADLLVAEADALHVLDLVAHDLAATPPPHLGWAQRRRVNDVRELLASRPGAPWRLDAIAATVACSTFHLARQFRAVTGESIGSYLTRLRLASALERIIQGERDLGRLAGELGFSSHSHLTARFRHCYGTTPRAIRKIVTVDGPEGA